MRSSRHQLPITGFAHKTAIVSDANHAAVIAPLDMAAERCGTAGLDGGHDAALATRESIALRGAERFAVAAEDIRHLQRGTHSPRCYSGGITSSVS